MSTAATAERARAAIKNHPEILESLTRYADEVGVGVDHVIVGALKMVAEDYEKATGGGVIPLIS